MVAFLGNTGVSRRLHRSGGRWVMEHQVFKPLGQGVFRPTMQRVQGESAILQSLQEVEALRQMTVRVMQDYGGAEVADVSFESMNGSGWRPCAPPEEAVASSPPRAEPALPEPSPRRGEPSASAGEVLVLMSQIADLSGRIDGAATHSDLTSLRDAVTEISLRDTSSSHEGPVLAELEELREKLNGGLEKFKDVATQPEVAELKDILCEVAERQERFAKQIRDLQSRMEAVAGPVASGGDDAQLSPEETDAMNAIASAMVSGETMLGPDG